MDEMTAFDQQIAREVLREAGPPQPVDAAAIFRSLASTRPTRWSFQTMFGATRLVVAGVIVAMVGGLVITSGFLKRDPDPQSPAAVATGPAATPSSAPASLPLPEATVTTGPDPDMPDEAMVMGPGEGDRLGGYAEVGRFGEAAIGAESITGVIDPVAIGDRLVMAVHVIDEDGRARVVVLQTKDGRTWLQSAVPGSAPVIDDLAATREGLLAVGHDGIYPDWLPRLWASEDGTTWTMLEAPPDEAITRIVSPEDPLAVTSFDWLWVQGADGAWVKGIRQTNMGILSGPGGFLAWDARAGEGTQPFMMHSTDLLDWNDVDPTASGLGNAIDAGDFSVYATGKEWILVPDLEAAPESIFTSRDGQAWEEARRPPRMGRPSWIAAVGDEFHALELNGPTRLWTWRPGEAAGSPKQARPRRSSSPNQLRPPVEWQGDWVSLAHDHYVSGPRSIALWRYDDGADGS